MLRKISSTAIFSPRLWKIRVLMRKCQYNRKISVFSTSDPSNGNNDAWQKAVSEGEKIVGFPTSFISLRALLSNEFGGLAIHLSKLVSTKHPLLKTARGIVFDSKHYLQTRGLIVLLFSKAVEPALEQDGPNYTAADIYKQQRTLAEITELVHIALLVHRGLVDVEDITKCQTVSKKDLKFGNKMAVLGGDFLLANACTGLAQLNNPKVVDLIASSIADISSSLIMLPETGTHCSSNNFKTIPGTVDEWAKLIHLSHGSLLSNACVAAMILLNTNNEFKVAAETFAKHLVLAQQIQHDILRFHSVETLIQQPNFSALCALPVVILSEKYDGKEWLDNFIKSISDSKYEIDLPSLHKTVSSDKHAMETAKELSILHADLALKSIDEFPGSDAKSALKNIVLSIR